jgi:hypothetical protein
MKINFSTKSSRNSLNRASGSRLTRATAATGHADKVKCPGNDVNPAEKHVMKGRLRV